MSTIRRSTATIAATAMALAFGATAAWGHASMQQSQVPAESEVSMNMRVPVERPGASNQRIEMQVQAQWEILDCSGGLSFVCDISDPDSSGRVVVVWERVTPNPAGSAEILFDFRARTPDNDEQGVYLFPTVQVYDNGEEVAWIQRESDADRPSPRVQVGDASSEIRDNPEPAKPHDEPSKPAEDPANDPPASEPPPDGGTTSGRDEPGTTTGGTATEQPTATPSPSATEAIDLPTAEATAEPEPEVSETTPPDLAADETDGDGGNGGLFAIAGVLLALAAGGAALYRWKFSGDA